VARFNSSLQKNQGSPGKESRTQRGASLWDNSANILFQTFENSSRHHSHPCWDSRILIEIYQDTFFLRICGSYSDEINSHLEENSINWNILSWKKPNLWRAFDPYRIYRILFHICKRIYKERQHKEANIYHLKLFQVGILLHLQKFVEKLEEDGELIWLHTHSEGLSWIGLRKLEIIYSNSMLFPWSGRK